MTAPGADRGGPDPRLADALAGWAADAGEASRDRVHRALADARLLVSIVALPAAAAESGPGAVMALPTLVGRDGRTAVPAFSGLPALAAWRPDARPVPVAAAVAAAAAQAEGHAALVLDVAGPVPFVVEGAGLDRLADQGRR